MQINPVTLLVIGALISFSSAVVGAASAILVTWITRRSEERKHRREIIVNAAIENWKQVATLLEKSGKPFSMRPLDIYLIHMAATADIIFGKDLSPETINKKFDEVDRLLEQVAERIKDMPMKRAT